MPEAETVKVKKIWREPQRECFLMRGHMRQEGHFDQVASTAHKARKACYLRAAGTQPRHIQGQNQKGGLLAKPPGHWQR